MPVTIRGPTAKHYYTLSACTPQAAPGRVAYSLGIRFGTIRVFSFAAINVRKASVLYDIVYLKIMIF